MKRQIVSILLVFTALFVVGLSIPFAIGAQAAPAASTPPKLSEDDTLLVQGVMALAQMANESCQGLESVKRYNAQLSLVSTRLEAKYTGYKFNWQSGQMDAKAPAVK